MYPPQPPYPPQQYPQQPPPMGQLEVELSFFFMMWILFLITPSLAINGYVERRPWGRHLLTLPAGQYHVAAWYPYLFRPRTSPGEAVVAVTPGMITMVRYRPAGLVFLAGTMRIVGQRPMMQLVGPPPMGLPPG